jgi:hypothetical protein
LKIVLTLAGGGGALRRCGLMRRGFYSQLANSHLAEPVDVKYRDVRRTGCFFVSSKALLASSPTSHPPRCSNHRASNQRSGRSREDTPRPARRHLDVSVFRQLVDKPAPDGPPPARQRDGVEKEGREQEQHGGPRLSRRVQSNGARAERRGPAPRPRQLEE